jgi:hypothetical protein
MGTNVADCFRQAIAAGAAALLHSDTGLYADRKTSRVWPLKQSLNRCDGFKQSCGGHRVV